MNMPIRNHRHFIFQSGKWVESLATYHNHWHETWGEFVASLRTVESVINRVKETDDFDTAQEYAALCYERAGNAAARYEKIRARERNNFQLRSLVEAAHSCYIWHAAGDYFSSLAAAEAAAEMTPEIVAVELEAAGSVTAQGAGATHTVYRPIEEYVDGQRVFGPWTMHSAAVDSEAEGVRTFCTFSELWSAMLSVAPRWSVFYAAH